LVTRPPSNTTILSRAYPRAAPGVLQQLTADIASGSLTITGDADRPAVDADLWVPARCTTPSVAGSNVGATAMRAVDGGWRITVGVPAAGPYSISVTCGAPAVPDAAAATAPPSTDPTGVLAASGGADDVLLPAALIGLALAVRAGGRDDRRSRARAGGDQRAGATRSR
jgi:hypothetical protein